MGIDRLDGRLIKLLAEEPRIGVLEASRRLGWRAGRCRHGWTGFRPMG